MTTILITALVLAVTLALIAFLAERRQSGGDVRQSKPLQLLPGDIKYESPSGNVRVYFPITTSIVLSIVLALVMRLLS